MDQKTVRKLERELEKAIAEVVIIRNKNWKYPLMPSQHTLQMMAKAATAVYETAVENHDSVQQDCNEPKLSGWLIRGWKPWRKRTDAPLRLPTSNRSEGPAFGHLEFWRASA